MGQGISELISADGTAWALAAEESKRQAIASLRGYAYQLHQSLAAWIALPDGATLHFEVAEDYAAIARDPSTLDEVLTATQIKDKRESGSVTLNAPDVLDAIRNFWSLQQANDGRAVRLVFLTTSPIGSERRAPLPSGTPGLDAWAAAARGGPVDEIRDALKTRLSNHAEISALLEQGDDDMLRSKLIAPIRFICGAPDITGIAADNRAAIVEIGHGLGGTPELAGRAADHLLIRVLDTIVESTDRRVTRGDLLTLVFDLISIRVPSRTALAGTGLMVRGIDLDATGVWRLGALPKGPIAPRTTATEAIAALAAAHGSVWVHGATGLGKSMLGELAAARHGGSWYVLDLRGATGAAASERLAAARSKILATPGIGGLLLDDLSPDIEADIAPVLADLAATLSRRDIALVMTSNHPPTNRIIRAAALDPAAIFAAPSFDEHDAADLVAAYGGEPARWAWFALLVGGTHPQLVDTAIAGLARAGWPAAAMDDWTQAGMRNSDVEAEREAARRRLLGELKGDALPFLARTARIIGTFDRPLALAVGETAPALQHAGLSLDHLTGHWIERVGDRGLRTSPLVSGLDREMFSADELRAIDNAICMHLIKRETIASDLLDVAFLHAILAQAGWVVNLIVQMIIKASDADRPKLASAMTLFRKTEAGLDFLDEYPLQRLLLYLAQHLLLTSIAKPGDVNSSAARLIEHLDAASDKLGEKEGAKESAATVILMKMLFDRYAFGKIDDWFPLLQQFRPLAQKRSPIADLFDGTTGKADRDPIRFIFLMHSVYLPGRAALVRLFGELDALAPTERSYWLAALHEEDSGFAMVVDNAWMKEAENADFDPVAEASELERLAKIAIGWDEMVLAGRLFRGQSVMLDEYAHDRAAADAALNAAEAQLPGSYEIARSRAKIAWRADDHETVVTLTKKLALRLGDVDAVEAAFVLREGAMSAGELHRYDLAARWFKQAEQALRRTRPATDRFATGLAADAAWARFAAGDRAGAVRAMADVLERLADIDPDASDAERAVHLVSRHLILWMRSQVEEIRITDGPVRFVPGAVSNPAPHAALAKQPMSPLAPAWMMLARAALGAGIPPDEVLGWAGVADARRYPAHDVMIRTDLVNSSIAHQSLGDFSRFLISHVEGINLIAAANWRDNPPDPVHAAPGDIPLLGTAERKSALTRDTFRDSAIAYGAVSLRSEETSGDTLRLVHGLLEDAADSDVLPEWSLAPSHSPSTLSSTVAHSIAALTRPDTLSVEEIYLAHLRILEWGRNSTHRAPVAAALAERVRSDWTMIITQRRALLRSPAINIANIEQSLAREVPAQAYVAGVLLAATPAVSVNIDTDIRAMLDAIKDGMR